MSYDLKLVDKKDNTFQLENPHEGGTMPVGRFKTRRIAHINYDEQTR